MAQKRMFDKRVVESDKFTDLPNSSKALYFMAGMSADDKGFFQPRRLQKMHGFSDDDFKILIAKGYFITFESGVIVITDWNKNNWLDSRRITETEYIDELNLLKLINERYELKDENNSCLANAKPMLRENRIEENNIYNISSNLPQKNNIFEERFEIFYKEYPRHLDKEKVKKWFLKNKPDEELFNLIMSKLNDYKKIWENKDKQYIPYPSTWLNQKRWEDEIEIENKDDGERKVKIDEDGVILF